jgi:prepilin-type N-terminal cleavage/methylation domain-containing protein
MNLFKSKTNKGFTLVELMVSVAIFVIISSVILARHSQFSGTILIKNLAYDIALSIRKAQVFGLSIREYKGKFDSGYGVHFNSDSSYIFFSDTNGNNVYNSGVDDIIDTLTLGGGNKISKFCADTQCSITSLDIVFNRPNPDAIITKNSDNSVEFPSAEVTIVSPQGIEWTIRTVNTGQISVEK